VTFGSGSSPTIQYSGIPAFAYSSTFWTRSVRSLPLRGDTTSTTSSRSDA
jgi:hypothetical protein